MRQEHAIVHVVTFGMVAGVYSFVVQGTVVKDIAAMEPVAPTAPAVRQGQAAAMAPVAHQEQLVAMARAVTQITAKAA